MNQIILFAALAWLGWFLSQTGDDYAPYELYSLLTLAGLIGVTISLFDLILSLNLVC